MRILLASTSSGSRGGGELCLLHLGAALRDRGHEVALWCATDPRMDELAEAFAAIGGIHRSPYRNTYHDRRTRSLGAYLDPVTPRRVAREWRALRPDVVHVNKQNLEDGLELVAAATRCRLPSVAMIHITQSARWLGAGGARLRDALARRRLRAFAHPLVTTPETRAASLRDVVGPSTDIRIIHNGVATPRVRAGAREARRAELGVPEDVPLFVEVARLEPQKDPFRFLELAASAIRSGSDARFAWVGSGSLEAEWIGRAAGPEFRGRVHHVPWTRTPAEWMAAADGFLHTARFEGLPFAVLEALALGRPVVVPRELLDEIPPFRAEGVVPVDDDLGWLAAIADPDRRCSLGAAARRLHAGTFSAEAMAERYEALYREQIERAAP